MKFKIGYFADGKWAHEAFNLLNNDSSIEIAFICVRFDSEDLILKKLAETNRIPYLKNKNINSEEFLDILNVYNCDLFVSMSFNQIFKSKIINLPQKKTINCHAGKLPFYRGRNVLNWALINDEKEFGITVHYVDEGIDTGDILLQRTFPITDLDSYPSLLEIAYTECANLLYDAINLIKDGKEKPIKQSTIHPVGFYCGMRQPGDEVINWSQCSRDIFNFVRALSDPGPEARTYLNEMLIRINRVEMIKDSIKYKGIPGQIVGILNGVPIVKTLDTTLAITEYEYKGTLKIGDRLK